MRKEGKISPILFTSTMTMYTLVKNIDIVYINEMDHDLAIQSKIFLSQF